MPRSLTAPRLLLISRITACFPKAVKPPGPGVVSHFDLLGLPPVPGFGPGFVGSGLASRGEAGCLTQHSESAQLLHRAVEMAAWLPIATAGALTPAEAVGGSMTAIILISASLLSVL